MVRTIGAYYVLLVCAMYVHCTFDGIMNHYY